MIPDEKIEEVRHASDIIDVVSDHVKLRRSGSNFTGLCPFHNEKTPSFSVSPKLGIYKCFGCGEGGDVFNFVMKMDGVGFEEAVRTLAERCHITIPEKEEESYDPRQYLKDGIYHALRFAGNFFYQTLAESDEAAKAREYLTKRGYPWKIVRKYGLGYAPDRFDGLLKAAEEAGINEEYLLESGLVKSREQGQGVYDTFRGRLMFPIFNPSGKVIAFGGRTLSESKKVPKYINSPQTPVYDKSEVLYGIQVAKNEIRKAGEVILVEGYTDVVSMHQAGIGNVVSTSGTSLTAGQTRVMKRYADVILMIFDADVAGLNAAVRGVSVALEAGMGVRILTLPDGEDPDSFVRQFGEQGFTTFRKKETQDFLRFLVDTAKKEGRWEDPMDRKKVISEILDALAAVPDELSRVNYVQELSGISRIGDRTLMKELEVVRSRRKNKVRDRTGQSGTRSGDMTADRSGYSTKPGPGKGETGHHRGREPLPPHPLDTKGADNETGEQHEVVNSGGWSGGVDLTGRSSGHSSGAGRPARRPAYEKELIRLMLNFGEKLIVFIGSHCNEHHFEDPELQKMYMDIVDRYQRGEPVSVDVYSRREHPFPELIGEIVMDRYEVSKVGMKKRGVTIQKDAKPVNTARGALKSLKIRFLERYLDKLQGEFRTAGEENKAAIQHEIRQFTIERNRYYKESPEALFPDYEHTDE